MFSLIRINVTVRLTNRTPAFAQESAGKLLAEKAAQKVVQGSEHVMTLVSRQSVFLRKQMSSGA